VSIDNVTAWSCIRSNGWQHVSAITCSLASGTRNLHACREGIKTSCSVIILDFTGRYGRRQRNCEGSQVRTRSSRSRWTMRAVRCVSACLKSGEEGIGSCDLCGTRCYRVANHNTRKVAAYRSHLPGTWVSRTSGPDSSHRGRYYQTTGSFDD
jgi:hypothetical protein